MPFRNRVKKQGNGRHEGDVFSFYLCHHGFPEICHRVFLGSGGRTSDLHLCCHMYCLQAALDSLGTVTNSGVKLEISLEICRRAYVESRGRRSACSVCSAQSTSAAGVLQQIDDTLGKGNGIAVVRTQHMLQVCPGLRNEVFYKDTSTGLHW